MTTRHERLLARGRRLEVAAVLATVGLTVTLCQLAPEPSAGGGANRISGETYIPEDARPGANRDGAAAPLPRSAPTHIRIAGTGIDTDVRAAPKNSDVSGGVSPAAPEQKQAMRVLWDSGGPSPGERGPAVLVGRLASRHGPAAFAGLGGLSPGDRIAVSREDGALARFEIATLSEYGPDVLPGQHRDTATTGQPRLRLVGRGPYGSVVVVAELVASDER